MVKSERECTRETVARWRDNSIRLDPIRNGMTAGISWEIREGGEYVPISMREIDELLSLLGDGEPAVFVSESSLELLANKGSVDGKKLLWTMISDKKSMGFNLPLYLQAQEPGEREVMEDHYAVAKAIDTIHGEPVLDGVEVYRCEGSDGVPNLLVLAPEDKLGAVHHFYAEQASSDHLQWYGPLVPLYLQAQPKPSDGERERMRELLQDILDETVDASIYPDGPNLDGDTRRRIRAILADQEQGE